MASSLGNCVICCCSFRVDRIAALPCGHTFHYDCVLQWVQKSKTCPTCRKRCIDKNIIEQLFFNPDLDTTISNGEDELDSVKKELHDKKKECVDMEKKLNAALSESSINLKERVRWQKKAEEGAEAIKKVGQLKAMLVDQNEKEKEIKTLRAKLHACKFYQLMVAGGGSEDKLDKYTTSEGAVDAAQFRPLFQSQIKMAQDKTREERKKRLAAESSILTYKRLVQELKEQKDEDLVERLDQISKEKRISLGGDTTRPEFTDSFLGSAMRPAPKGRINIGKKNVEEEYNTVLDIPSTSRRPFRPSPEKDIFDVVMSKKVSDRIGHSEKMSNGMGSAFSMKNPFDRLSTLPIVEKENRPKPYERVGPKKKVITNNSRLSDWMKKKEDKKEVVDLDSTICID